MKTESCSGRNWRSDLANCAYNLWMSAIRQRVPVGMDFFERMNNPKIGDLVMEITSRGIVKDQENGIGVLVSVDGDRNSFDCKWVIETENGTVSWSNCKFVAIPMDFDWYPRLESKP